MASGGSVQGQAELARSLDAAARELTQLADADDRAGELLANQTIAEAPHRSGYLASTIEHAGAVVRIGAPYGVFVHARNPFAARAMEQLQDKAVGIYAEAIADVVARVKGSGA